MTSYHSITGATRVIYVIGHPIHQIRTPTLLNARSDIQAQGIVVIPMHVKPDGLAQVIESIRYMQNVVGAIVTIPHKPDVIQYLDNTEDDEDDPKRGKPRPYLSSVNVLRRVPESKDSQSSRGKLYGINFDGIGFVASLKARQTALRLKPLGEMKIFLAGAGGVASAIAYEMVLQGATHLVMYNRTWSKAQEIKDQIMKVRPSTKEEYIQIAHEPNCTGFDLVINSTSLGMKEDDPYPVMVETLSPQACVAEVIMMPEMTKLLKYAKDLGCPIHLGVEMLKFQVDLMASYLLQAEPND